MSGGFPAFVATRQEDGSVRRELTTLTEDDLLPGEVTVEVAWSSVNFKDALASVAGGGVARRSPLVPGVDLAGTVLEAEAGAGVAPGDQVLVHGYGLGVDHHGGFAGMARVPSGWVVPLPAGLDARTAMAVGTAGFTAFLSVRRLEDHGLVPGSGPVVVTGASGGVGSVAVAALASRGHEVVASTGKAEAGDYLRSIGASGVIGRDELAAPASRPLESERWAGGVDCVGGTTLATVLRQLRYGAAVAASGLTGGRELPITVLPFILRAVELVGVDSVSTEMALRREIWADIAGDAGVLRVIRDSVAREVDLDGLAGTLDAIRSGGVQGRVVVKLGG